MYINKRHIQPKYDLGRCTPSIVEYVNNEYSNQLYSRYLKNKMGVSDCRELQFDKFFIKKQLLDLEFMYDPDLCVCFVCLPPCGIKVTGQVFNPTFCYPPTNISVSFSIPEITCSMPKDVLVTFSYNS